MRFSNILKTVQDLLKKNVRVENQINLSFFIVLEILNYKYEKGSSADFYDPTVGFP